jgi:hypothetical protein
VTSDITKSDAAQRIDEGSEGLFDSWLDPIETALRERVRGFIETLIRDELEGVLARPRYGRRPKDADAEAGVAGHRHGSRSRTLTGTFERHNADPRPLRWTKSADDILASIERFCRRTLDVHASAV